MEIQKGVETTFSFKAKNLSRNVHGKEQESERINSSAGAPEPNKHATERSDEPKSSKSRTLTFGWNSPSKTQCFSISDAYDNISQERIR